MFILDLQTRFNPRFDDRRLQHYSLTLLQVVVVRDSFSLLRTSHRRGRGDPRCRRWTATPPQDNASYRQSTGRHDFRDSICCAPLAWLQITATPGLGFRGNNIRHALYTFSSHSPTFNKVSMGILFRFFISGSWLSAKWGLNSSRGK